VVKPLSRSELEAKILESNRQAEIYMKVWNLLKRNLDDVRASKAKTTKNSSGYFLADMWNPETDMFDPRPMFVGAQGTTGIISEITYKLVSAETESRLLVMFLKDLQLLPELTHRLLREDVETLEVYDDHTVKFAVKFFGSFLKEKGIIGSLKYALQFMPEFFMAVFGGMPKLIVLAEFVSNDAEMLLREARVAQDKLKDLPIKTRITKTQQERDKYFAIRHDSFKLLSDHSKALRTAPFIDDIVVPVEHLPEYLPALTEILDRHKILYTIAGHLGNGNLHVIPLMDFNNPKTADEIITIGAEVYPLVKKFGGSMTAEHNDGLVRTPYIPLMFGDKMASIFKEFKEICDPHTMWNPKKKVGATMEDFKKFMVRPKGN
ncbi:MAG TPA: FAD-linked oxidase C-terminal domain-containing protein, partial [bacterium]|nr:FAD-linked oxidase C-terminal domain-containing protein [bacterium]